MLEKYLKLWLSNVFYNLKYYIFNVCNTDNTKYRIQKYQYRTIHLTKWHLKSNKFRIFSFKLLNFEFELF